MRCNRCGNEIKQGSLYCENCGKKSGDNKYISIKLNTIIILIIIIVIVLGISALFYFNINNTFLNNSKLEDDKETSEYKITEEDNVIDSDLYIKDTLKPSYQIDIDDYYIYIDNQGNILGKSKTNAKVPIIIGIKSNLKNMQDLSKLCDDDISKLYKINNIVESLKKQEFYEIITKIIIDNDEYILYAESEEKNIYIGNGTDIDLKIKYAKSIMEKEKASGNIYLNGNLQDGFKPYFSEKISSSKEFLSFVNDDIERNKNVVDGYWENIKTTKNITKIKEKNWYNIKQEQKPFLNITRKEFFVNTNTVIALISIAYDDGKVVDIKFTGVAPDEILKNDDNDILEGYGLLIFSMPQLLKYATEDEELSKYLQDILVNCWDNNDWYLNEFRQGIKFSIGADRNNYLNIEFCLSNYVSQ